VDTNDVVIKGNIFRGTWTGAPIVGETTLSARLMILDNVIYNSDTSVYCGLDLGALNTTGIMAGNYVTALYPSPMTKIGRIGYMNLSNNYWSNTVSERGVITFPSTTGV